MEDKKLRENGPPDTFDNTMISTYIECPRKFYYFMRRLDTKERPLYFPWGTAFGQGINKWHGTEGIDLIERKGIAIAHALSIWESLVDETTLPTDEGNNSRGNLVTTLGQYIESYPEKENWKTLGTEVGFKLPVPGTSIFYAGSLDAYIHWPGYGLMNREDKTTGNYITRGYLDQWEHASQIPGYQWALNLLTQEKIAGTLMNIISKRPQKDFTKRFSRDLVDRHDWRISEFIDSTVEIADTIRREWNPERWRWVKLGERTPMNCAGGPGKSACAYRQLCLRPINPWDLEDNGSLVKDFNLITRGPWKPWEREGNLEDA